MPVPVAAAGSEEALAVRSTPMSSETDAQSLPPPLREQHGKARQAFERGNLDYAIALLENVLRRAPSCYEARELLRATQIRRHSGRKGLFRKVLGMAGSSGALAHAQLLLRTKPQDALAVCEGILSGDPDNAAAHRTLAQAAMECGYPRTAVLSLEVAHRQHPQDRHTVLPLCEALFAVGKASRAEELLKNLLKSDPGDPDLRQALKDASARRSLSEGGYQALEEEGGSYRDIIRDQEKTAELQQEEKPVQALDALLLQIRKLQAELEDSPGDLARLRALADLHRKAGQGEEALRLYQRLVASDRGGDPALHQILAELQLEEFERREARVDPADEDCQAQRDAIAREREAWRRNHARQMVERFPSDTALRFELGKMLWESGELPEAIKELQKAQKNPHLKHRSRRILAQCFTQRNMLDLAERTLKASLAEMSGMDEERMAMLYDLGVVQEKSGRPEEAIEHFKSIYETDIEYRDVAERVDRYYQSQ